MAIGHVSLTDVNGKTVGSVEHDQTARICRLILLYTLRKINLWSHIAE